MKYAALLMALFLAGCSESSPESQQTWDPTLCQFDAGACERNGALLALSPASAPSEKPLTLSLELAPGQTIVDARIEGRDMFMGVIPVRFDDSGNAEVIYGSCASGYMVWRLMVTTEDANGEQKHHLFDWLADAPES
ncbi:hypothetical protein KUV89_02490 [Marinobacter hydrocarbonoclasticus]|nr:hypothetical protein [Marinobacter nauticus]